MAQVAAAAGLGAAEVAAAEDGTVSEAAAEAIGRVFGLDMDQLQKGTVAAAAEPLPGRIFLLHNPGRTVFLSGDVPTFRRALDHGRAWTTAGDARGLRNRLQARPREVAGLTNRDAAWQGYRLARELRAALGLGAEPLGDPRAIAEERLGAVVLLESFASPDLRAGAVLDQDRAGAAVVLSARLSDAARARFAIAHELGHLVYDPLGPVPSVQISVDRDAADEGTADLREARANGFAAELLLPQAGVAKVWGRAAPSTVGEAAGMVLDMQRAFGAPPVTTIHHLGNLGWYPGHVRAELLAEYAAKELPAVAVRPEQVPSLPRPGEPPVALRGHVGSTAPSEAWAKAGHLARIVAQEQRTLVEEALRVASAAHQQGLHQKSGASLLRAVSAMVERGDGTAAVDLLDALVPDQWSPVALLGLVRGLRMLRVDLEGADQRLVESTHSFLKHSAGWDEARVSAAMRGL